MRIISGRLGGRTFSAPKGNRTHPMSEKARGGLFTALGDISGLSVLDAFAGSGALSLEAVSRGAISATAIDNAKNAIDVIKSNSSDLNISEKIKVTKANSSSWSDKNPDKKFDLVFAAPPYDNLQIKLIEKLTKHLKPEGVYVLDWPGNLDAPMLEGLKNLKQKKYGDAQLVFYKKIR